MRDIDRQTDKQPYSSQYFAVRTLPRRSNH